MKLNIGNKELNIKFGYKPTLKTRLLSKLIEFENVGNRNIAKTSEVLEDLLLFIPEFLLVGLQVNHEEYRYDYDTGKGKDEQLDKVFLLVEEYLENEDSDIMSLFQKLEEEMFENSFLKKMFQEEQKKLEEKSEKVEKKKN